MRTLVVPVKASTIVPPTNLYGGVNQLHSDPDVIELSWTPIAASVLGYEVQRRVGGIWSAPVDCYDDKGVTLANPRPTGGYCLDKAAAGATDYRVFTKYLLNGTPTSTATAAEFSITANLRPCPPSGIALAAGNAVTWTTPTTGSLCDATRVSFYRVYRYESTSAGQLRPAGYTPTLATRVFKTSDKTVTQWTDPTPITNKTYYWVTAVDDRNAESTLPTPAPAP